MGGDLFSNHPPSQNLSQVYGQASCDLPITDYGKVITIYGGHYDIIAIMIGLNITIVAPMRLLWPDSLYSIRLLWLLSCRGNISYCQCDLTSEATTQATNHYKQVMFSSTHL